MDLRLYVTKLEGIRELYYVDQKDLMLRDSLIFNYKQQLTNRNEVIIIKDTIIDFQNRELIKSDKIIKQQNKKSKIEKSILLGILGVLVGVILIK